MGDMLPLPAPTVPFGNNDGTPTPVFYSWLKSFVDLVRELLNGTGPAWKPYTPTISSTTGALTSVTATGRFQQLGKLVFVQARVNITTVGGASGSLRIAMPVTPNPAFDYTMSGWELDAFAGAEGIIQAGTLFASVRYTSGSSLVNNGASAVITGVYEAA